MNREPLCRCEPGVCLLHPSQTTCGMRERRWCEAGDATPPATLEYIRIAERLCRDAGCRCPKPLLGWTEQHTPRCRLCNIDAVPAASGDVERLIAKELRAIASWIRTPGNVWHEDAIDECARVLENRAADLAGDHSTPGGTK